MWADNCAQEMGLDWGLRQWGKSASGQWAVLVHSLGCCWTRVSSGVAHTNDYTVRTYVP